MAHDQTGVSQNQGRFSRITPLSVAVFVIALVFALVVGFLMAIALSNIGSMIAAVGGVAAVIASLVYVNRRRIPSEAAGTGLYLTALATLLTPILYYIPMILSPEGEGAEAAGAFLGGLLGFIIWTVAFAAFAIVFAAGGYALKRRARRKFAATTESNPAE